MIEVNLLPGAKKRASGRGFGLPDLPEFEFGGLPQNRWVLGSGIVVVVAVVAAAYLFLTVNGRYQEVEAAIEEAAADSARYADLIQQAEQLRARRDSIAQRVEIIQEIDQDRYVWPHLLDEVARALPEYTWMTSMVQTSLGEQLQFRITGMAGNNFALTTFMENLEASPYVRGVTLINTQLTVQSQGGVSRTVNDFTLEASYEDPPMEIRETVPLFGSGSPPPVSSDASQTGAGAQGADTAPGPPASAGSGSDTSDAGPSGS